MSTARVTLTVRLADMDRTRLLIWEMQMLVDRMRVMANPEAEPLERLLDRYLEGGDDDDMEEPMTTELAPIEGATVAHCPDPDCDTEVLVMPDALLPTLIHHGNGEHTFVPYGEAADPDDIKNDPIPEPAAPEPSVAPGEPEPTGPEPAHEPKET